MKHIFNLLGWSQVGHRKFSLIMVQFTD